MAEAASVFPAPKNNTSPPVNTVMLDGRIDDVVQVDGEYWTRVILPAKDSYSKPGACRVRSKGPIGRPGNDVTIECEVTGFPRRWKDGKGMMVEDATTYFVPVTN